MVKSQTISCYCPFRVKERKPGDEKMERITKVGGGGRGRGEGGRENSWEKGQEGGTIYRLFGLKTGNKAQWGKVTR
jgi:hypothetical protein